MKIYLRKKLEKENYMKEKSKFTKKIEPFLIF